MAKTTKVKQSKNTDSTTDSERYIEAVGRRKRAVARVRITPSKKGKVTFIVNGKDVNSHFPTDGMQIIAREALNRVKGLSKFNTEALIKGGGVHAQAEALRHGLARALVASNEEWRPRLKKSGLLKRDPRKKERKKFGKKKARKSPQWSKR